MVSTRVNQCALDENNYHHWRRLSLIQFTRLISFFRPFFLSRKKTQKKQGKKMLLALILTHARFFAEPTHWVFFDKDSQKLIISPKRRPGRKAGGVLA